MDVWRPMCGGGGSKTVLLYCGCLIWTVFNLVILAYTWTNDHQTCAYFTAVQANPNHANSKVSPVECHRISSLMNNTANIPNCIGFCSWNRVGWEVRRSIPAPLSDEGWGCDYSGALPVGLQLPVSICNGIWLYFLKILLVNKWLY